MTRDSYLEPLHKWNHWRSAFDLPKSLINHIQTPMASVGKNRNQQKKLMQYFLLMWTRLDQTRLSYLCTKRLFTVITGSVACDFYDELPVCFQGFFLDDGLVHRLRLRKRVLGEKQKTPRWCPRTIANGKTLVCTRWATYKVISLWWIGPFLKAPFRWLTRCRICPFDKHYDLSGLPKCALLPQHLSIHPCPFVLIIGSKD